VCVHVSVRERERKRSVCVCVCVYFILREITHKSNNPHGRRSGVRTTTTSAAAAATRGYAKFSEGHPVDI
jgi:hypothetical protein